ncbi:MAG: hypothetical protein ABH881_03225 [bacterium]
MTREPPAHVLAALWLQEKGFVIASRQGEHLGNLTLVKSFSVFRKNHCRKTKSYFFGLIKIRPKLIYVATVRFNYYYGGYPIWIFDINPDNHDDLFIQLIKQMAFKFGAVVQSEKQDKF